LNSSSRPRLDDLRPVVRRIPDTVRLCARAIAYGGNPSLTVYAGLSGQTKVTGRTPSVDAPEEGPLDDRRRLEPLP